MGKIIRNGIEFSSTSDTANNINYDNTQSGLSAVTAQEAIDEVNDSLTRHVPSNNTTGIPIVHRSPCIRHPEEII